MFIEVPIWVTELNSFLGRFSPVILKKSSSSFESLIRVMIFYSLFSVHYWLYLLLVCSNGVQLHLGAESLYHLTVGLEASPGLHVINFRTLITVHVHCFSVVGQHPKGKTWALNLPLPCWFLQATSAERACQRPSQVQAFWWVVGFFGRGALRAFAISQAPFSVKYFYILWLISREQILVSLTLSKMFSLKKSVDLGGWECF